MAPKKVAVTYAFGRRDRVDPKHAPFGVLAVGKNLRIRKDGRLGVRNGYQAVDMSTANGTLIAYDLHEYQGRLLALGSDGGDGYPTELFEYLGLDTIGWRGTDPVGRRVTVNPFTNMREVGGVPLQDSGVVYLAAAAGAGHVCLVYFPFVVIVNAETDQVVHAEDIHAAFNFGVNRFYRVVFAEGTFYVAAECTDGSTDVRIRKFELNVDTSFQPFATAGSGAGGVTLDLVVVQDATTARLALAIHRTGTVSIFVFTAAGTQLGSTITLSVNSPRVSVDADQVFDTIVLWTTESGVGKLRTYNFAGTLLAGPTTTTSGTDGFVTRLPAQSGFTDHVAVLVNDASLNAVVQYWAVNPHTLTDTATVQRAVARGRAVSGQSPNQPMAVAFSALIGPDLTTFEGATNALFFVTPSTAHVVTRDLRTAEATTSSDATHPSIDETTGTFCWPVYRDPGLDIDSPAISLLDFRSTERRESVPYGGLLYFSGATPSVYDGRFVTEQNFGEFPAILSTTPSDSGSDLVAGTYSYVAHWEWVSADGALVQSPVSDPVNITLTGGQDRVTLSVQCPHTVRVALGSALYQADVSVVLSRTVWDASASTPGSIFRRCKVQSAFTGMANYGRAMNVVDGASDSSISAAAIVYTQTSRGVVTAPVQNFAPSACQYITATESRLVIGGLPHPHEVQISKAAYLGEQYAFSPLSNFFSLTAGSVRGVRFLDGVKLVFTADRIYAIGGDGPDDIGAGALDYPREIPTPSGLSNSWSFLDAPDGLWFQLDDSKLFRMPRGGGAPTWEGVDVHDTLVDFPRVVGAAKHRLDSAGVFACSSADATDARFLVRDFRTEQWFEDTPLVTDGSAVAALTSFGETVAYISAGGVYSQVAGSFTDDLATFIPTLVRTQPLYPFGLGGYGQIYEILLTGEYRGDCQLNCRVSYDDGTTFTTLESFEFATLTVGQTVQRKWTLPQDITSSLVVEFGTAAVAVTTIPEGIVFLNFHLTVVPGDGQTTFIEDGVPTDFTEAPPDAFEWLITTEAHTNALFLFGPDGFGSVLDLTLTALYLGDCILGIRVSYDEGESFTTLPSVNLFAVDGGLTVGNPFIRVWELPEGVMSSLVVEFTVTGVPVTLPTEGIVFNQVDVLVGPEDGLRELDPDEMA